MSMSSTEVSGAPAGRRQEQFSDVHADVYESAGSVVAIVLWKAASPQPFLCLKPVESGQIRRFALLSNDDVPVHDRRRSLMSSRAMLEVAGAVPDGQILAVDVYQDGQTHAAVSLRSEPEQDQNRSDELWQPEFSRWRHGGWYVHNVRYPSGAIGCVSNNYPDENWRIVCDDRRTDLGGPGDFTFRTRDAAARAERDLAMAAHRHAHALPSNAQANPSDECELQAASDEHSKNENEVCGDDMSQPPGTAQSFVGAVELERPKRPPRPLEPKADHELVSRVLDRMDAYSRKPMVRRTGEGYIVAVCPVNNRAIAVVDGDFGLSEFKAVHAEIAEAGLASDAMIVVANTATYSGRRIQFSKFDDLGLDRVAPPNESVDRPRM